MSVLETRDLSIRFGGVQANRDVSIAIGEGENVGLVKGTTVRENLITAQYLQADYRTISGMFGSRGSVASERRLGQKADALAEVLGLTELLDTQVAGLPYGT